MNLSPIAEIVEKFINASDFKNEMQLLPDLIDYFENKGPSNFRLAFWNEASLEKKEVFIRGLFNHLISLPSEEKIIILKILRNLFIDSEKIIKKKTLMIFYSALLEKNNFKISISALDFFTHMFSFFSKEEKSDIFGKLMLFIDIAEEDIADEGINAIGTIIEYFTSEMRVEFFNVLCKLTKKKNLRIKYVSFENLEYLIKNYPNEFPIDVTSKIYSKIFDIGEKSLKIKDTKTIMSYLRLILLFNVLFDKKNEKKIQNKIDFCIDNEADPKEILFIIIKFLQSLKFLSYEQNFKKIVSYVLKIIKKRIEFNPIVIQMTEEIIEIIWEFLPDSEKDKFYKY